MNKYWYSIVRNIISFAFIGFALIRTDINDWWTVLGIYMLTTITNGKEEEKVKKTSSGDDTMEVKFASGETYKAKLTKPKNE